jgi:pilus assembly protein Flp/PilA
MVNKFKQLVVQEEGQGMTEYGLVLGVIAVGAVAIVTAFGEYVEGLWEMIRENLEF